MPKDSLFPDDEPVGIQIWHKQGKHYEHVATVESNALGAIVMTTHGFMGYPRWQDNPAVTAMPGDHRSTTIGDVLIGPDGRSLELSADDGLSLKPIAPVDQSPSDAKGTPEKPRGEADPNRRVLDGLDAEFWMDGIAPDEPGVEHQADVDRSGELSRSTTMEEAARRDRLSGRIGEAIGAIGAVDWDSMTLVRRVVWLEHAVDWDGFTADERFNAIENFLAGKDRSRLLEDTARAPDPFDRLVADLPRQWRDDGPAAAAGTWEALPDDRKLAYLADRVAAQHPVSFERLADAAERVLGLAPGQGLKADEVGHLLERYRDALERQERSRTQPQRLAEGGAVAEPPQQAPDIRVLPGQGNPLYRGEDRSFDIHDAAGKVGHLAGYMGGKWSENVFGVTHVEISRPGRSLTPGEWKGVLRGLREQLPDAEYIAGNRAGWVGDLSPAYEKLARLRPAAGTPAKDQGLPSPSQIIADPAPYLLEQQLGKDHGQKR
jgi:hypothetical protein